jgi:hypothetical protein
MLIALIVGGVAVYSLRSLSSTASTAVANARANLPAESVAPLEDLANDISSTSSTMTLLLVVLALLGALAAGALAMTFSKQITAPIVRLRNMVAKSADTLPAIVQASANGTEVPQLPAVQMATGDEVEDLAMSFNQVQQTATSLAVNQARIRQENAERFVNLGRRSQNLLARQMKFIDGMESNEANPANLKRLFQIDHLATRMRRNAESILVLAGEESRRRLRVPVSMHQVVQAASSEIEHFERVSIENIGDAAVEGSVAPDLAHLLAELLENATSFSPPESATSVTGQATADGYVLEVVDQGIGMDAAAMEEANSRFANPGSSTSTPAYLGHDVVARLSERHGVGVSLSPTAATGGVTARVLVPTAVLATGERRDAAVAASQVPTAPVTPAQHQEPAPSAPEVAAFAAPVESPASPEMTPVDPALVQSVESAFANSVTTPTPVDPALVESVESAFAESNAPVESFEKLDAAADAQIRSDAFADPINVETEQVTPWSPATDEHVDVETIEPVAPTDYSVTTDPVDTFADSVGAEPVDTFADSVVAEPVDTFADSVVVEPVDTFADSAVAEPVDTFADSVGAEPADTFADSTIDASMAQIDEAPAASDDTASDDTASDSAKFVPRGLTPEQRAAIAWAMEKGGSLSRSSPGTAGIGSATELRPGPIDAETLAELGSATTDSGLQRRRRGTEGAKHFSPVPTPIDDTPRVSTPRNADQLMAFREGIRSGRAASAEAATLYDEN